MLNISSMTSNEAKILIVDDERAIREMVCHALDSDGFACLEASDAHKAEALLSKTPPDLILLDWMMPGVSGIDFVRALRRNEHTRHIPVIMLTAKTEEQDMVRGLDSGADDFLTKPFSTRELMARIRALLRRSQKQDEQDTISIAGLSLDNQAHRVTGKGKPVELGPTEYKLLAFFMQHTERVFSREQLLNNVWGDNIYVEERTVDVHIRRLRKALETTGHNNLIQTVRGAGYRLSEKK